MRRGHPVITAFDASPLTRLPAGMWDLAARSDHRIITGREAFGDAMSEVDFESDRGRREGGSLARHRSILWWRGWLEFESSLLRPFGQRLAELAGSRPVGVEAERGCERSSSSRRSATSGAAGDLPTRAPHAAVGRNPLRALRDPTGADAACESSSPTGARTVEEIGRASCRERVLQVV